MITDAALVKIVNQLHEIGKRAKRDDLAPIERGCERIKSILEQEGVVIHNPINEKYDIHRTDCEANIISDKRMVITEVIKPIIYITTDTGRELIQQGLVVVE